MDVIDSNTQWEDRAFYFCGKMVPPVVARIWRFRSEDEYDSEEQPETMALTLIRSFAECLEKRPFLLLASYIGSPTPLRSKKGVLWDHKELRQLPHIAFESECERNDTRLGAVVDLSGFGFDSASSTILNWGQGMIVLCNEPLATVTRFVEGWFSRADKDVLAYDYDKVSASLEQNAEAGILRYLPPSSTRTETVVVVANEAFVGKGACECIDAICRRPKGNSEGISS